MNIINEDSSNNNNYNSNKTKINKLQKQSTTNFKGANYQGFAGSSKEGFGFSVNNNSNVNNNKNTSL